MTQPSGEPDYVNAFDKLREIADGQWDKVDVDRYMSEERSRERILCAAIWINNGAETIHQPTDSGLVFCGHRHHSILEMIARVGIKRTPAVQGFLTNMNRFVTRNEAAEIAFDAGQIAEPKTLLYSEDLY